MLRTVVRIATIVLALFGIARTVVAELYKLENVKRIDSDIYKADGGLIIKTRYCYHYAYGEDAIYDDDEKKIIWKDGDSPCDVAGIYK